MAEGPLPRLAHHGTEEGAVGKEALLEVGSLLLQLVVGGGGEGDDDVGGGCLIGVE